MATRPRKSTAKMTGVQARDFLYENPPLVEVIVDIAWKLIPVPSVGGAIDPNFSEFAENFQRLISKAGYTSSELTAPPQVPLEFLANQVTRRYRKAPGKWPLFQIGPGIMTTNITPPYNGWADYRNAVRTGIETLFKAYPEAKKRLKIEKIQLRYINAFDTRFGVTSPGRFVADQLSLGVAVPAGLASTFKNGSNDISLTGSMSCPLNAPDGAIGRLEWNQGSKDGEAAILLVLDIKATKEQSPQNSQKMLDWLDESHLVTRSWFQSILSKDLKKNLGKKTPLF